MRVLLGQPAVQNFALPSEAVRARIDQRTVFQVLVCAPLNGVERYELGVDIRAALAQEAISVLEEFADRGNVVVEDAIGPERVVVDMALRQQTDRSLKKRRIAHA